MEIRTPLGSNLVDKRDATSIIFNATSTSSDIMSRVRENGMVYLFLVNRKRATRFDARGCPRHRKLVSVGRDEGGEDSRFSLAHLGRTYNLLVANIQLCVETRVAFAREPRKDGRPTYDDDLRMTGEQGGREERILAACRQISCRFRLAPADTIVRAVTHRESLRVVRLCAFARPEYLRGHYCFHLWTHLGLALIDIRAFIDVLPPPLPQIGASRALITELESKLSSLLYQTTRSHRTAARISLSA